MATETLVFPNGSTTLDRLLWKRFGREVPGLVEQVFDTNPGLAALGVFPPRGTMVIVKLPGPAPTSGTVAAPRKLIRLTGN